MGNQWNIYRDQNDEEGIFVYAHSSEVHSALVSWFGSTRIIYMPDLQSPTFDEFGESKAAALQAALSLIDNYNQS